MSLNKHKELKLCKNLYSVIIPLPGVHTLEAVNTNRVIFENSKGSHIKKLSDHFFIQHKPIFNQQKKMYSKN